MLEPSFDYPTFLNDLKTQIRASRTKLRLQSTANWSCCIGISENEFSRNKNALVGARKLCSNLLHNSRQA